MKNVITALAITLLIAGAAHAELESATEAAVSKALASGKPTIIELGARSCPSCKKMAPIIESLSNDYRSKAMVLFIDVNKYEDLADKFHIQMIPTQIIYNAQGKEVKRHMGFYEKAEIVKELKAAGLK